MLAPNLNDKLVEILSSIQKATEMSANFAIEQLPDIVQSYVAYGRVVNTVYSVLLLLTTLLLIFVVFKIYNAYLEECKSARYVDGSAYAFLAIFPTVGAIVFSMATIHRITECILVWVAPKIWLLQSLSNMVK